MVSVKIDNVTIGVEQGTEWINDGTEEFDLGTLIITNSSRRLPYPDFADVEITLNSEVFEACISQDISTRLGEGVYQHEIKLAEVVIKLSLYPHPDRLFTTKSGAKTTYKVHAEELLSTAFLGKTAPVTIATATLNELDVSADEKEYSGGDLFKSFVDLFRTQSLVPTLSLDNVIGHQDIKEQGSLISFDRIDGEVIQNDISTYAMRVYSKVKNATYEANLIAGGTYYPDKDTGVTPRSSEDKYADVDAQYLIDSGIRKMIDVRGKNITTSSIGTLTNLLIKIVSKEEWDNLEFERDSTLVYLDDYKNNTPYFIEGDNVVYNIGTEYDYEGVYLGPKDVINQAIRKAIVSSGESESEFVTQSIKDIELTFYYQPIRDMDIVQERHNIDRVTKYSAISNQQKDSKLELRRFGNANKSLINSIGNPTYQVTVRYYDKDSPVLKEIGDYTSNGYRIIKRQFLMRATSFDVTYLLTKNQRVLNPVTSVKRNFVSPFTISKRNILTNYIYESYIEFSDTDETDNSYDATDFKDVLMNVIDFDSADDTPLYNAQYRRGTGSYINMSVQRIPMGNSFEFNAQFLAPKIAGYQLVSDTIGSKKKPVSYADANGEVDTARFYFMNTSTINSDLHPIGTFNSSYLTEIPSITYGLNPDEIMGITYAKHCVSFDENLIIGNAFLEQNSLIKELGVAGTVGIVYYNDNPRHSVDDINVRDGADGTGTYIYFKGTGYFDVNVPVGTSWAIYRYNTVSLKNELLFAWNNTGTDLDRVYVNLLRERQNIETL